MGDDLPERFVGNVDNPEVQTTSRVRIRSPSMETYPRVKSVQALKGRRVLVVFSNDIKKIYDCSPLLGEDTYSALAIDVKFKDVKADQGGYGISWNDEIDLAESELWINGVLAEHADATNSW
jgi:hypothetical protein